MSARKKTVFVVYYSMYGHIEKMARAVCKGLEKSGVSAKLYQVIKTNGVSAKLYQVIKTN